MEAGLTIHIRPQYHFTPPAHFMNDPNGLVYYQGEYHLFYQHNPFGDTWGHMSWGHAVSPDLVHWTHLPVALYEEDETMIFSGSAVVDWHNSSGLCAAAAPATHPCLVAVYTGHTATEQTQNVAGSHDRGRTWTRYAGNPVLASGSPNFRDPKVFWHTPTGRWVMVVALADQQRVGFYASADLKRWEHLSDFGPAGATGGMWECPDFFPLAVDGDPGRQKWVLKVDVNPGAIAGGSGGQYFIGHFDGTAFVSDDPPERVRWIDYGKDFYAAQSWSDVPAADGRCLWLGWMSNWQYALVTPTAPWRGALSIPRAVTLKEYPDGIRLVQRPVAELQALRDRHYGCADVDSKVANAHLREWNIRSPALEIAAECEPGTAAEFGLKVRKEATEGTCIGYDVNAGALFVDRTRSGNVGFDAHFPGRHAGPVQPEYGTVKVHVFVDECSVEVFGNDGQTVITDLIFPSPQSTGVEVYATGGSVRLRTLDVWTLRSACGQASQAPQPSPPRSGGCRDRRPRCRDSPPRPGPAVTPPPPAAGGFVNASCKPPSQAPHAVGGAVTAGPGLDRVSEKKYIGSLEGTTNCLNQL